MSYEIELKKIDNPKGHVRAMATLTVDDSLAIFNVSVVESKSGKLFVSMPQYKTADKDDEGKPKYKEICHPISGDFRSTLYDTILQAYRDGETRAVIEKEPSQFKMRVTPFEKGNLKGLVTLIIDDEFVVNNFNIMNGSKGLFVSPPSLRMSDNTFQPICDQLGEFKGNFREAVLGEYKKKMEKQPENEMSEQGHLLPVHTNDAKR